MAELYTLPALAHELRALSIHAIDTALGQP